METPRTHISILIIQLEFMLKITLIFSKWSSKTGIY